MTYRFETLPWLDAIWTFRTEREQEILTRRADGEVLASIAADLDITRERVRQIQSRCQKILLQIRDVDPEGTRALLDAFADRLCVSDAEMFPLIEAQSDDAKRALLSALGMAHPKIGEDVLSELWCLNALVFDRVLRSLATLTPMTDEEAFDAAHDLGIPTTLTERALEAAVPPLIHHGLGWIRRGRSTRDIAYLLLRERGVPQSPAALAAYVGTTDHNLMENLRRDKAFAQLRPEGTWALADWHLDGADNKYANAVEAVVDVLRELGPLTYDQLKTESQRRYPVSDARIKQCLISNLIGVGSDGRYDLAERGATPVEEPQPRQPATIKASGRMVGIDLAVDRNMLRGSGVAVHKWLTWYLGLHSAPSTKRFALNGSGEQLTISRATSNAQISSLRAAALRLGVVAGCRIVLLLNLTDGSASIKHVCPPDDCPAPR